MKWRELLHLGVALRYFTLMLLMAVIAALMSAVQLGPTGQLFTDCAIWFAGIVGGILFFMWIAYRGRQSLERRGTEIALTNGARSGEAVFDALQFFGGIYLDFLLGYCLWDTHRKAGPTNDMILFGAFFAVAIVFTILGMRTFLRYFRAMQEIT